MKPSYKCSMEIVISSSISFSECSSRSSTYYGMCRQPPIHCSTKKFVVHSSADVNMHGGTVNVWRETRYEWPGGSWIVVNLWLWKFSTTCHFPELNLALYDSCWLILSHLIPSWPFNEFFDPSYHAGLDSVKAVNTTYWKPQLPWRKKFLLKVASMLQDTRLKRKILSVVLASFGWKSNLLPR